MWEEGGGSCRERIGWVIGGGIGRGDRLVVVRREMSAQGRCCIKEKLEYKAGVNIL